MPAHNEHSIIFYNYDFLFERNLSKYKSGHKLIAFPSFFHSQLDQRMKRLDHAKIRNFDLSPTCFICLK